MAWTNSDPVAIGRVTKKVHYDTLWANADYLYDFLGDRTLFLYENAAPTGWAIVAGCTDGLLAVKGGAQAYNVAGGTKLAGTWTHLNHLHTGNSHAHTTSAYAVTEAEMPAHTHTVTAYIANTAGTDSGSAVGKDKGIVSTLGNTGGGATHTHGDVGAGGTANTGNGATANTWRPLARVGILVSHTGGEAGWDTSSPVTTGLATQKAHYDDLWDNLDFIYDFIVARKIFIFEAAAPTGWQIIAAAADALLAVKGGATYTTGGDVAGTWTQPDHTHTAAAHTHVGAEHALTLNELATHNHELSPYGIKAAAGTYMNLDGAVFAGTCIITGSTGEADPSSHAHNANSDGAVATAGGASANTWRPLANIGILVEITP